MHYISWFDEKPNEASVAGGKGAALSKLATAGFAVPAGFVIHAAAFQHFAANLNARDNQGLGTDPAPSSSLEDRASLAEAAIEAAMPDDLVEEISAAYKDLTKRVGPTVAVRSSATSEDGPSNSFAGLFDTFLNVRGAEAVIEAVQRCYASIWSQRVVGYYARRASEPNLAMAVVVMEMIHSETSGVVFTAHPVTGDVSQVVINATWGLGEALVSGAVTPDSYVFSKDNFALVEHGTSVKEIAIVPAPNGTGVIEVELEEERAAAASLDEDTARQIAELACQIENYFGRPQDIEFAVSEGRLYILQSRPITTL